MTIIDDKIKDVNIGGHSFEHLADLFRTDPDKFYEVSQEIIAQHIDSIEDEYLKFKMQAHQSKIDYELSKIKDPHAKYLKMQDMFYEGLNKFQNSINNFSDGTPVKVPKSGECDVLPFKVK